MEGLLSDEADETLTQIAEAIEEAGLRRKSLVEIANLAGASDPWNIEGLLSSLQPFRHAMRAYGTASEVAQFITEHRNNPSGAPFSRLTDHPPLGSTFHRAELFAMWLRTEPKPQGGKIGTVNISGSTIPVLNWLLSGHVTEIFKAVDEDHHTDLEQFIASFLRGSSPVPRPYSGNPMGRGLYEARMRLEQEIQQAAHQLDLPVPDHVERLPGASGREQE